MNKEITAKSAHVVTAMFEQELSKYTGAPFVVCVDSATSALELCLWRENVKGLTISIPERTYMSVPCAILLSGAKIKFLPVDGETIEGQYRLEPTRIWDSALRFTADMHIPNQLQCISFTGALKHLKLGKGGAILCDNEADYEWFKRARNSGRGECSYHSDSFTMLGRNVYLMPQVAAQGLLLMQQFYNLDGSKRRNPDLCLPYPNLSLHPAYK